LLFTFDEAEKIVMEKALIIEDDQDISNLISIHLADMQFSVDTAFDGKEGLMKALNNSYRIIILDIRLPGLDGFEVCKKLRQEKNHTPVLMVTSKSEEIDKIIGLEIGADDYLTKPFSIRELMARVKAILRRSELTRENAPDEDNREIKTDGIYINIAMRIVEVHGRHIELSPKEFDLMVLFASNPGRTYTRTQLLEQVWGYQFEGYEHTVNSHINRLRAKIEQNLNNPEFILTTWGVGYKFRSE
jgi:DNA-binding response OmpR family regulator